MSKEAMKLALEALETLNSGDTYKTHNAATALRQAIEQAQKQEPVAKNECGSIKWLVEDWPQNCFLYAEPPTWTPVEIGVDVTSDGAHVVGMYVLPDAVRYVFYSKFHSIQAQPSRSDIKQEPVATDIMREMLEVQGQHGNWNYDSYMHGLYNGMEYMVALAEKREPKFRDAPETWLAKHEVKRDNFNNVVECKAAHGIKENNNG
jgi:hypothetical protein